MFVKSAHVHNSRPWVHIMKQCVQLNGVPCIAGGASVPGIWRQAAVQLHDKAYKRMQQNKLSVQHGAVPQTYDERLHGLTRIPILWPQSYMPTTNLLNAIDCQRPNRNDMLPTCAGYFMAMAWVVQMNKAHDMLQSPQCSSWQGYANHVYDGHASSFTHVSPMQHGYMSAHFHTHDEMMHDAHFHTHDAWSSFMPINIPFIRWIYTLKGLPLRLNNMDKYLFITRCQIAILLCLFHAWCKHDATHIANHAFDHTLVWCSYMRTMDHGQLNYMTLCYCNLNATMNQELQFQT